VVDLLEALPFRTGRIARWVYEMQIRRAPRTYNFFYRHRAFWGPTVLLGIVLSARMIRRVIRETDPVVAVSTYPWASHVLGRQQRKGRLPAVVTVHTDYAPHRSWVHPGVGLHLALHATHAEAIAEFTDADVRVSGPVVSARFQPDAGDRAAARRRLGLPSGGRLALVTGGAWGVGELEAAAGAVAGAEGWTPVVLCGRDEQLLERLRADGCIAVGWTELMPDYMHACDVLIDTTGGVTGQEARAAGLQVISFRPIPGHGRHSAEVLDAIGMTVVIDDADELARVLERLGEVTALRPRAGVDADAADLILAVAGVGEEPPVELTSARA
jgi:UDP-N-acetylglucosamine:LPS N-acetylglucosamine transferase